MNIMLVCSAGMSTSLLVSKMKEAAVAEGLEATIWAIPEAQLQNEIDKCDVILLGPQVRFLLSKIQAVAEPKNIPVQTIDMMNYGTLNGKAVLEQAKSMLNK
ncbi:MAG: PTS sugar transporter subunit IIB [Bacillaceae bacterium]